MWNAFCLLRCVTRTIMKDSMRDKTGSLFSQMKPADTPRRGDGLREFFLYRDLGALRWARQIGGGLPR